MNYVDYSSPLVFIQNFTLVTLKVNAIQYIGFVICLNFTLSSAVHPVVSVDSFLCVQLILYANNTELMLLCI